MAVFNYYSLILTVAFMAKFGTCVDHNYFLNCSRVDFCNDFRDAVPEDVDEYMADLSTLSIDDGTARIDVNNQNGNKLKLQIVALTNDRYRMIINEETTSRYKLKVVLDGEPEQVRFNYSSVDEGSAIIATETQITHVYIQSSPFIISFFYIDNNVVEFQGHTLIMQVKEDKSPFAFSLSFPKARQLYGIHEHADVLALRNTKESGIDPYRLRNLDVAGHEAFSPMSLYGAVPVLYGHGNETAGIFLHNAAQQWYDIQNSERGGATAHIMVESGMLDLFILMGPTPKDVVRQYTGLTGTAHLPQLWTLGYHQSRWNYENQSDVKDVIMNFDLNNFQIDAIWLDIDYTDGRRYFRWNPETFDNPIEMQQNLSTTGRHLVTIIDPHIKVERNYTVYAGTLEKDLFIKNADGTNFEGDCWPGKSSYMDFLNPEARSYYGSMYHYDNFAGSTETLAGIWNDMNEPSVFNTPDGGEGTVPGDVLHKDPDGNLVSNREIHNIYGLLHTMATHQGLLERDNNTKRPFVLTRSHFSGSQRYSAFWTGDNDAQWDHLKISYPQCLNANLLGLVFCGADIGGFASNPTEELLQRWYQAATWTPFYRSHCTTGLPRREPYLFSEEIQTVIRDTMNLRYRHLPVWYTLFFEHTMTGDPIIRPLFYHYTNNTDVLKIDDQLLLGSDIMVKAVTDPGVSSVNVYFPNDIWYSINSDDYVLGPVSQDIPVNMSAIPVYYRGGGLIPRKDLIRRSTEDMTDDCYTLYANLGQNNLSIGTLYVDDLSSFKYRDENDYEYVSIEYEETLKRLKISPNHKSSDGGYNITICDIIVNKLPDNIITEDNYITKKYKMTQGKMLSSFRIPMNKESIFYLE